MSTVLPFPSPTVTVTVTDTFALKVQGRDAQADPTPVIPNATAWSVDDPSVLQITPNQDILNVSASKAGTTVIHCQAQPADLNGPLTDHITVIVKPGPTVGLLFTQS